jgi:acyl-CoA thioesterase FadM
MEYTEALIGSNPITIRRRVGWGECDPATVVYTPRFCDYALSARDWFLREGLSVLDRPHPAHPGITYPMRAMAFDFNASLKADDIFDMVVTIENIGRRSFSLLVVASSVPEGGQAGARLFSVTMTCVCVDGARREVANLADELRCSLESYREKQP